MKKNQLKLPVLMRQKLLAIIIATIFSIPLSLQGQRSMERPDRGVVAVPGQHGGIFLSWRLLNTDPQGGHYNVFRKNADGSVVKVNREPISDKTNFEDLAVDPTKENRYYVEAVNSNDKSPAETIRLTGSDDGFALAAVPSEPYFSIPLRNGAEIHFCWVGDLDGDGTNDYVIDRLNWGVGTKLEAYRSNGTFLWDVDYGPNSANMDNISPGSATIDVGHWDGVTVADLTGDGRAEVVTKIANGVRFGNGEVWSHSNNNLQWVAVLDGRNGARISTIQLPTDYLSAGPVGCQVGVGNNNEIFVHAKNRNSNGSFNIINVVYSVSGSGSLTQKWKRIGGLAEAHQFRIVDVNEDGVDDMAHIGYVLNGVNGTVLYTLPGVIHGDRFHIGKFDPNRPGLQGYGVQQVNPSGLLEYYYDARNGQILWTHIGGPTDVGRGNAADIDPSRPGYEVWSFSGIYNAPTNAKLTDEPNRPWPNFRLWWDADNGSELFDNGKIEAWDPSTSTVQRLLTCSQFEGATGSSRGAPLFYGDIWGDWREEVIMRNATNNRLIIFTTNIPTTINRGPLTQDRYYRNCLTLKGYMQSHHTSYYLGEGGGSNPVTYYRIQNRGTGLFLDGMGRTTNGEACGQYANTTHVNAQWERISTGSYNQLRNRGTGMMLDGMGRTADGATVGQYASSGSNNQQWSVQQYSGNYYRIQNRATGLYLDGMGRTANGDSCGQYANTTHVNAQWQFLPVSGARVATEEKSTPVVAVEEKSSLVQVYPNPAVNEIKIVLPTTYEGRKVVNLFDRTGKVVKSGMFNNTQHTMYIKELPPGIYFLKLMSDKKIIVEKVIKK